MNSEEESNQGECISGQLVRMIVVKDFDSLEIFVSDCKSKFGIGNYNIEGVDK